MSYTPASPYQFSFSKGTANYKAPDLKADNLLVGFEDSSVIDDYVRQQKDGTPLYKEVDGHPIYQSRADFGGLRKGARSLKISDFGAAGLRQMSSLLIVVTSQPE